MKTTPIAFIFGLILTAQASALPHYVPGGNVSVLSQLSAMTPMSSLGENEWWYFAGTVHDQFNKPHSLELVLTRTSKLSDHPMGIAGLGFTLKNAQSQPDYLWNFYPDINSLLYCPIAPFRYSNANDPHFYLSIASTDTTALSSFSYTFSHDPSDTHAVGQIDARYDLKAEGVGEMGYESKPQLMHYQIDLQLQDKRGLVPEGLNGFVGPLSEPHGEAVTWEMAMPFLSVTQWTMKMNPLNSDQTFEFHNQNTSDRLWLDRQMVYHANAKSASFHPLQSTAYEPFRRLYHGMWNSFCFNKVPYQNVCGVAVAIWNKGTPTQAEDSDWNASTGFLDLYTPDSNGKGSPPLIGNTYVDFLYAKSQPKTLPYRLKVNPNHIFESSISHQQYASEIDLTLRSQSIAATILNRIAHHPLENLYVKFTARSTLTENIMIENTLGFYEGAATVSLCDASFNQCHRAGDGFLEQMGE